MKKLVLLFILNFLVLNNLHAYWEKINNGLTNAKPNNELNYIVISDLMVYHNTLYASTNWNGVFTSTDNGNNWIKKNNGIKGERINFPKFTYNNNYLYVTVKKSYSTYLDTLTGQYKSDSSGISGIYYSSDGGENWFETKRNGLTDSNHTSVISANDSLLIVGTDNKQGVYISKDNGESWVQKNNGLKAQTIYSIIIKDNIIYLGSSGGVFLSSDYGENWISKLSTTVYKLYLKGDTLIAGQWVEGVSISTDNGENWEQKNNGLREKDVMAIASINDYIFIGIKPSSVFQDPEGGIHFSSNNGDNWNTRNNGFRQTGVSRIALKDDYIFCSIGYGNADSTFGMYRAKIKDLINPAGVEIRTLTEEHFYAEPAKPNPASDIVHAGIYWDDPFYNVEYAEKGIYNIMGNRVSGGKDLNVNNIQPYSAEIVWNCSQVSSGLYFIALYYNGKTKTVPVLVTR